MQYAYVILCKFHLLWGLWHSRSTSEVMGRGPPTVFTRSSFPEIIAPHLCLDAQVAYPREGGGARGRLQPGKRLLMVELP